MRQKLYVATTGCMGLRLETGAVVRYLEKLGYELVSDVEEADIIIISTCGVTDLKEKQSLELVEDIMRKKKGIVYLMGCGHIINEEAYSRFDAIKLKDIYDVERLFPSRYRVLSEYGDEFRTFSYIPPYSTEKKLKAKIMFRDLLEHLFGEKVSEWYQYSTQELEFSHEKRPSYRIIISRGCMFRCSYCAVWKARNGGKYTSIPVKDIIKEFERGKSLGYRKFILVGDELGGYGLDIGTTFVDLLGELKDRGKGVKIGIRYMEPIFFIKYFDELKDLLKEDVFYFCVPIQSGSKRILRLMNRHYCPDEVKELLKDLRKSYEGILITHLMVGFPSETDEDFKKSVEFVKEIEFDNVVYQPFSLRPGTKAVEIVRKYGLVDREIVRKRIRTLDFIVTIKKLRRLGKVIANSLL